MTQTPFLGSCLRALGSAVTVKADLHGLHPLVTFLDSSVSKTQTMRIVDVRTWSRRMSGGRSLRRGLCVKRILVARQDYTKLFIIPHGPKRGSKRHTWYVKLPNRPTTEAAERRCVCGGAYGAHLRVIRELIINLANRFYITREWMSVFSEFCLLWPDI